MLPTAEPTPLPTDVPPGGAMAGIAGSGWPGTRGQGGQVVGGRSIDGDWLVVHLAQDLDPLDRSHVGIDRRDNPGDLSGVACLAFNNDLFAKLGNPQRGIRKHLAELGAEGVEVGNDLDFVVKRLPGTGRDREVGRPEFLADESNLIDPGHEKVDHARVANRDDRILLPCGELLLER
jgi:hypothetical protein